MPWTTPHAETRRQKALTIIGLFIVFATFVWKEAISERLKDLTSAIESANNLFVIRQALALTAASLKSLPPTQPAYHDDQLDDIYRTYTPEDKKSYIAVEDPLCQTLAIIISDLAASLPEERYSLQSRRDL
jgi:hypothetical protein